MHDRNGHALTVGDFVVLHAKIVSGFGGEEFCNVTLESIEPMYPGTSKTTVTLNSHQVVFEASGGPTLPPTDPSIVLDPAL